ncbi:MAG: DUF1439 domain-containing protein [Pontibacterium sp.]
MKNLFWRGTFAVLTAMTLLLSGCTQVAVSQEQINDAIAAEIAKQPPAFEFPVSLSGNGELVFDAKGLLASATLMLVGESAAEPEGYADIFLILNGQLMMQIFGQRIGLEVDALPHVRSQLTLRDEALYLKNPQLLDLDLKMPSSGLVSPTVTPAIKAELSQLIANHFENTPVFKLSEIDHPMGTAVKSVTIVDEGLVFSL